MYIAPLCLTQIFLIMLKQGLKTVSKLEQELMKFKGTQEEFRKIFEDEAKRNQDEVNKTRRQFAPLRKSWQNFLSSDTFDWCLFGTLTAQGGLTSKQITKHIEKWFEIVCKRFESNRYQQQHLTDDDLTIFWVAEANTKNITHTIKDRFHVHVLIQCKPFIFNDVYDGDKYRGYNTFDVAWQFTQGRKPFIWKTCPDTGVIYKHELNKFRVQIVPLSPTDKRTNSTELKNNRIKYCAKYVAKDMIQYGFLKPSKVKRSYFDNDKQMWISSEDYEYKLC